jgi:hypothetical protein
MKKPRDEVRARRARLVERAENEREELGLELDEWRKPLRTVDRGLAVYRGFKRSMPVIGFGAGVGMAALAFIRPQGITGWINAGLEAWKAFSGAKPSAARRFEKSEAPSAEGGAT